MIGRLSKEEIEDVLRKNILGHLGCNDGENTYVVPVSYVYDGKFILAHSVVGKKIHLMRKNPKVCFEVAEIENYKNWKTVIISGEYQELKEERDRYQAMKYFVDRMVYMKISETAIPPETTESRLHPRSPGNIKPVIYRIVILEKTGRYELSN